jgi:hypothetical protein
MTIPDIGQGRDGCHTDLFPEGTPGKERANAEGNGVS